MIRLSSTLSVLVWLVSIAVCQTLFDTVRPDVTVVVKKHPLGADIVDISYAAVKYPPDQIRRHVARLAEELHSQVNGLRLVDRRVGAQTGEMSFMKANFGVVGIIDREHGSVNLQAVVRAFAGDAGPYTIRGIAVVLDGELPTSQTLRQFPTTFSADDPIQLQGIRIDSPPSIEYRILLNAREPDKVVIPSSVNEVPVVQKPIPPPSRGDPLLYALVVVAALAAGVLVYALLLRPRK